MSAMVRTFVPAEGLRSELVAHLIGSGTSIMLWDVEAAVSVVEADETDSDEDIAALGVEVMTYDQVQSLGDPELPVTSVFSILNADDSLLGWEVEID